MLIGTSGRESVICPLLLVVVLCGYQIYEFEMSLRFILSLNSICKGRKLYLHEVPDINIAVCNPLQVKLAQIFLNKKFRAHIWGRFGRRSRLVKVDFDFSLVSREVQVTLYFQVILPFKIVETKCMGTLQIFIDLHPSPIGILYLKLHSIYKIVYMQTRVNVNNSAIKKNRLWTSVVLLI
jgi:hypothetical protein